MSVIDDLIAEFVVKLRQAIASEAAQAFVIAGGGGESHQPNPRGKPGPKPKKGKMDFGPGTARKGGKRTAEEIEAQGQTILSFLKKNPASGAEAIGAAIGMTTGEMALPISKLIADKAVKHVGQKRGRKYTAK